MKRKKKLKSVNTIPWQADAVLNLIFIVWSVLCIVPFLLVLGVSFSSESSLNLQGYRVIPKELSFAAYDYVFSKSGMLLRAYGITIGATLSGTILSLIVTAMFAYPLSRKYFKYRKIFSFIAFFTMIFNGGAVSSYMVYTQILYMKNNYFVYILPYLMSAWNMILLRTFMTSSIPDDLVDAAKIDGAGEPKIFSKIVIPLCGSGRKTPPGGPESIPEGRAAHPARRRRGSAGSSGRAPAPPAGPARATGAAPPQSRAPPARPGPGNPPPRSDTPDTAPQTAGACPDSSTAGGPPHPPGCGRTPPGPGSAAARGTPSPKPRPRRQLLSSSYISSRHKKKSTCVTQVLFRWCARRDLNPHVRNAH